MDEVTVHIDELILDGPVPAAADLAAALGERSTAPGLPPALAPALARTLSAVLADQGAGRAHGPGLAP